jgi:sterol desaturase/sphingolipid hydroxylase (fatty acid hydroxylase superfamily)
METAPKPQQKGTKKLFNNPVIEKLSRTHIAVPLLLFFVYSAVLLYWSAQQTSLSLGISVGMFAIGFFVFTWVEYQVHRHIFHMGTHTTWRKKAQYLIHGVHHEFPKDKDRLAMPPLASLTIATLLLLLCRWLMGDYGFTFMAGFMVSYASYLWVHYLIHAYPPPNNFLRIWWINHSIHHYKNGTGVFGVSSPLWDYLYGTMKIDDRRAQTDRIAESYSKKSA